MARMYPSEPFNTNSQAEINLFYHFKKQLSDEFVILHSFAWLTPFFIKQGFTPEKEIDFIILHKIYGILVIEVKGGDIQYKQYAYSTNNIELKERPTDQVKKNMHHFRCLVEKYLDLKYVIGFAVAFTDSLYSFEKTPYSLKIETDDKKISFLIDKNDLLDLQTKIINIMSYWKNQINKNHNHEMFTKLIDFLIKTDNTKSSLQDKIEYDNKKWLYLSHEQDKYLKNLIKSNLMYISGRAGTGKTIIAIILSRYLNTKKNKKILFLTFNKNISKFIESQVYPNTDAMTFHKFLKKNVPKSIDIFKKAFEALDYIIKHCENKYDCLIVDEAQSLQLNWLIKLKEYFSKNNKAIFIFADTIQTLSNEEKNKDEDIMESLSIKEKYILTKNYRAPEKVHNRLNEFFEPSIEQSSIRELSKQDLFEVFDDEPRDRLDNAFEYLEKNKVNMKDVALLMQSNIGGFTHIKNIYQKKYPALFVETISKFRGMEKPIVIVLITIANELNELYVAYSRSTTQTIVILHKPMIYSMPDFASLLLESDRTPKKLRDSIEKYIDDLKKEFFIKNNKINYNFSAFEIFHKENFWIIKCDKEMNLETKLILHFLNNNNQKVIVFENNKLEKVKFFDPYENNESDYLKHNFLSYSKCYNCKKDSYINEVSKNRFCILCSDTLEINKKIFNSSVNNDNSHIFNLISKFKKIKNRIENVDFFIFLNNLGSQYSLIAYIELLQVIFDEFKRNDTIYLNYLRDHKVLNNHIYLQSKWTSYCQHLTSKLINFNILRREKQGIYILNI